MLQKMRRTNDKGFTLIELMIVIAIIGILAAIAIPNFISYRNKSFCSGAESDANNLAASIADWYAIPTNTALVTLTNLGITTMSNKNVPTITGDPNGTIIITISDASTRCPTDYTGVMTSANNPRAFWNGSVYQKSLVP